MRTSSQPRVDLALGALVAVAVVVHAVSTDQRVDDAVYLTALCAAAVAAWVGAERGPAPRRLVGRLVAGGLTLTALGDTLWTVLDSMGLGTDVSVADPAWFASYVLLAAAVCVVLRRSGAGRDLDFTIDAVTIVVVSVMVLWHLSVDTIVAAPGVDALTRGVWATYPIADAVLLALVLRVLTSRVARRSLDRMFGVGIVLWLAADLGYLASPGGTWSAELMDAAWMVAPVLLARGAWQSGEVDTPPRAPSPHGRPVPQLALAFGPLLVPPLLELVAHLRGMARTPYSLVVGASVLVVLAFARSVRLVRAEQRALRDLAQARDDALDAYRSKSMFLATMSHEIRTPLTMVLGAGELLEATELDDFQRGMVQRVRRSGTVLRSLVDVVLDYSRLEAGQLEVVSVPVDLRRLVDTLATTYGPCAEARGVEVECVLDPGLPQVVAGDPERLVQVLGNLLDNAVKFTPEGRVRLAVRGAGEGSMVEYVVEDTGIGIPEEHLASVFESFTQVDPSTTRRHGGIGLGLAICCQLTGLMGGTLGATSRLDAGSTFVVRLPLVPVDDPAGQAADQHVGQPVGQPVEELVGQQVGPRAGRADSPG